MKPKTAGVLALILCLTFLIVSPNFLFATEQKIFIKQINIRGNTVIPTAELKELVKIYENKELTLPDLHNIASTITDEYKKRGFIISSAFIPQQEIRDGVVEITIVEGRVGNVIVQGEHKYYSSEFIEKHFNPVKDGKPLDQKKLERALLVLNDYSNLNVKATLQAGKEPGTSDLLIDAENSFPAHVTIDYNNFGSSYNSRSRYGLTFDVGNLIKEGTIISVRGVTGDDPSELFFGRASFSIPVNTLGTRVGIYYSTGDNDIGEEFAVLDMEGSFETYGIYVTHPFIKVRNRSLTGELSFDVKNTWQDLFGATSTRDYIRSVRGGLNFDNLDSTGKTTATFAITQGLGEALGGMDNNDPKASRLGADNGFTKLNLELLRLQKLQTIFNGKVPVYLILRGLGQWSSDSLVASEQFSVGGADTVRGFLEGEYLGDHGYALTAELRLSTPPIIKNQLLQLAFFVDNGGTEVRKAVSGQHKSHNVTGAGTGIRLSLPYDIDIRADVGFPLDPSENSDNDDAVFYLQGVKRF